MGLGKTLFPKLVPLCTHLDLEPLGHNTSLFSYFALFPCYRPLLVGPKSHLFFPKGRSQQGVVSLRVQTTLSLLLRVLPFIGLTMSIIHHVTDTLFPETYYPIPLEEPYIRF